MATSWKSQQGNGEYSLQFETDNKDKYKLVEKAAQMAVDGKTAADVEKVKHGAWIDMHEKDVSYENTYACSVCNTWFWLCEGAPEDNDYDYCPHCGAKMDGEAEVEE